jgi:diacylglycerol kinase (ATP)
MRLNASTSHSKNVSSQQQRGNHLTLISKSSQQPSQPKKNSVARQLAFKIAPNLLTSFRYAGAGVSYAFKTQRNFRIHLVIGAIALGLGAFLQVSAVEMAIIGITIAFVLALELLNTALESVVDLTVKQTYHELAKVAKDCAAGAVLIGALAALFVAGVILLPPLLTLVL